MGGGGGGGGWWVIFVFVCFIDIFNVHCQRKHMMALHISYTIYIIQLND